jgi:hypothetical protein
MNQGGGGATQSQQPTSNVGTASKKGTKKIMVVDDDPFC